MATRLFVSYHEADAVSCDEFLKHLRPAERAGKLTIWHRRRIRPGEDVLTSIHDELEAAHIIILLISVDLLACDYLWSVEVSAAIYFHNLGRATLIPVILRACNWRDCLPSLQPLPSSGQPLLKQPQASNDDGFADVAQQVISTVDDIRSRPSLGGADDSISVSALRELLLEMGTRVVLASPDAGGSDADHRLLQLHLTLRDSASAARRAIRDVTDPGLTRMMSAKEISLLKAACSRAWSEMRSASHLQQHCQAEAPDKRVPTTTTEHSMRRRPPSWSPPTNEEQGRSIFDDPSVTQPTNREDHCRLVHVGDLLRAAEEEAAEREKTTRS